MDAQRLAHSGDILDGQTPGRTRTGSGVRRRSPEPCERADLSLLVRAVETEVIPRLLSAHKAGPPPVRLPGFSDVERLAAHVLENDSQAAHRLIRSLVERGVGVEAIYLNLLGATARMLGEMWERDQVNFVDVTVGLCTLHQILFRLAPEMEGERPEVGRRALFAPVPGETHVFGALIVARFFARAGWRSWTEINSQKAGLSDLVGAHEFDLIGLSISGDRHIDTLTRTIEQLREVAPNVHILIGGHCVDNNAGLAERVGADSSAPDPLAAVGIAEGLVDRSRINA